MLGVHVGPRAFLERAAQELLRVDPAQVQALADAIHHCYLRGNFVFVIGPAIGGAIVVAGSPGVALAIDAGSFAAAALLLVRIAIPARIAAEQSRFFHELREGWREFTSRTWLWSTVVIFGLGNFFFMFWPVLGPTSTGCVISQISPSS